VVVSSIIDQEEVVMVSGEPRSTIGLRMSTKEKLDRSRAPGQCYDGFLCQLVDMWEEVNGNRQNNRRLSVR
jgi:hypothetical protein